MSHPFGHQPNLLPTRERSSRFRLAAFVAAPVIAAVLIVGSLSDDRNSTATITDQLPQATPSPEVSRTQVSRSPILSVSAAVGLARGLARDSVRWFDEESGRAYEAVLATGVVRTVSDTAISGFVTGIWVPGKEQAIVVSEQPRSGRSYRFINFQTGFSRELEPGIFAFAVSSDASRIAYVVPGAEASNLVKVAATDGSDARTIFRTRLNPSVLAWQGSDALLLSSWKTDASSTDLVALSVNGQLSPVLIGKANLEFIVSDRGDVLISYIDENDDVISSVRLTDKLVYRLNEQVAAHKCGWGPGNDQLLCGIPRDSNTSERSSSLSASDDSAILIDVTGSAFGLPVSIHENRVGIVDPVLSSSGTRAAFVDLFDRRVHVLEL